MNKKSIKSSSRIKKKKLIIPINSIVDKHKDLIKYLNHNSTPFSIFDNREKKFIYCNNKFITLCGLNEHECYNLKFKDFEKWIHPDDQYTIHNKIGIRLRDLYNNSFDTFPLKSLQFNFQFNFRLREKNKSGNHNSLLAQCSVIKWDEPNVPFLLLNQLSDISHHNACNKIVLSINTFNNINHQWTNVLNEEFLNTPQMLTKRELEIFKFIVQDISALEISKLLSLSFYTVRTHWRNILSKTGCSCQNDLKLLAQKEGWA